MRNFDDYISMTINFIEVINSHFLFNKCCAYRGSSGMTMGYGYLSCT